MKSLLYIIGLTFVLHTSVFGAVDCSLENQQEIISDRSSASIQDIYDVVFEADISKKIYFSDQITERSINRLLKRIRKVIDENRDENINITITLASGGGDINQTLRGIRAIKGLNSLSNVQIDTKVTSSNTCESACTILFLAGQQRYASQRAQFGFHSPHFERGDRGERTRDEIEEIYRSIWLDEIRKVDAVSANLIHDNEYLYDARMSMVRGSELNHGYVTDLL